MKDRGFVYSGMLTAEELRGLLPKILPRRSEKPIHLIWDLANISMKEGLPGELLCGGTAFNERCEVRWQRVDKDRFRVWLLSDEPLGDLPLYDSGGAWYTEEERTQLISLNESRFRPPFMRYPYVDTLSATLRCRVFYRDGVAIFVSPRGVVHES